MTWRIVDITSNSKLELKLNYMVVRDGQETHKVYIPEIAVLVIESTAVSITSALLCELNKQGVKIIFCDEKRNPYGELMSYYGTSDCVMKIKRQITWDRDYSELIWSEIIRCKVAHQAAILERYGNFKESRLLKRYCGEIIPGDKTNREGIAAKVYFNALFGEGFYRGSEDNVNSALNYGYSILLSAINRNISSFGYSTIIGIFHSNDGNPFNLGSDLMEPFRPYVDEIVLNMDLSEFGPMQKQNILGVVDKTVSIGGKKNGFLNALRIYVQSFFTSMESNDIQKMRLPEVSTVEAEVHESDGVL